MVGFGECLDDAEANAKDNRCRRMSRTIVAFNAADATILLCRIDRSRSPALRPLLCIVMLSPGNCCRAPSRRPTFLRSVRPTRQKMHR
jgi:hypothetical protein